MMLWDWLVDSNFDVVLNGLSVNVVACAVLDCSWDAGYHGGLANIIAFTADRRLAAAPDIKHKHAAPYFIIHKMRVSALSPSFPAKTSCVSGSIWTQLKTGYIGLNAHRNYHPVRVDSTRNHYIPAT